MNEKDKRNIIIAIAVLFVVVAITGVGYYKMFEIQQNQESQISEYEPSKDYDRNHYPSEGDEKYTNAVLKSIEEINTAYGMIADDINREIAINNIYNACDRITGWSESIPEEYEDLHKIFKRKFHILRETVYEYNDYIETEEYGQATVSIMEINEIIVQLNELDNEIY